MKLLKYMMGKSPLEPLFSPETRQKRYLGLGIVVLAAIVVSYKFMTSKSIENAAFIRQTMINLRLNDKVNNIFCIYV